MRASVGLRVLVTGATGLIGSAVVRSLERAGYTPVGLVRSDGAADKLARIGIESLRGDLHDPPALGAAAASVDAVIHIAAAMGPGAAEINQRAVDQLCTVLAGTGKRFLWTGGTLFYGNTGETVADERSALNPLPTVAARAALQARVLASAASGVHPVVIHPACVYGNRRGNLMLFYESAKRNGAAKVIGSGQNRWPTVHCDDLGRLYQAALEQAPSGSVYIGAARTHRVLDLAGAASTAAGAEGRIADWPLEEARQALGPFAAALLVDQQVDSSKARAELGWVPRERSAIEELLSYSADGAGGDRS